MKHVGWLVLFVCVFVRLFVCLFCVCLFVLLVCLFACLLACLFVWLFGWLVVLFVCVCGFPCVSVCLCVCLCVSCSRCTPFLLVFKLQTSRRTPRSDALVFTARSCEGSWRRPGECFGGLERDPEVQSTGVPRFPFSAVLSITFLAHER